MARNTRRLRWATLAATLMLVLPLGATTVGAQTGPQPALEVLGAEYDYATSELRLGLRAGGSRDQSVQNLTILIDNVPRTAPAMPAGEDVVPAVLLVIDVSGSMEGAPIASAAAAASALVSKLAAGDTVGLVTFANQPSLPAPLTSDHGAVQAQIAGLFASGETALHDAVILGLDVLGAHESDRRVIVLLSDGEESGVSAADADEVRRRVDGSGVEVYSFALGAGADSAFLADVSARSGGAMWEVADDAALADLFATLGGRLGASSDIVVRAPGLTPGRHAVEVRARIDGVPTVATYDLEVPPPAILLTEQPHEAAGNPIEFALAGVPEGASLRVQLGDHPLAVTPGARVIAVDPWAYDPGDYVLRVRAELSGVTVAFAEKALRVPELDPALRVTRSDAGTLEATLRWQGPSAPALVALAGGEEIGRSTEGTLSVTPPATAEGVEFRVLGEAGEVLATESVALTPAEGGSALASLLALAAVLGIAGGGGAWFLRRRKAPAEPQFRPTRRPIATAAPAPREAARESAAKVVVTSGTGEARTVAIGLRPVTLGAHESCDIAIDGPGIRPQHARVALTRSGELRVHGLAGGTARPYQGSADEQWLTLQPGDEIAIGSWSVRFCEVAPQEEAATW